MGINASFVVLLVAMMVLVYALLHLYLNSRNPKRCRGSNKRTRTETEKQDAINGKPVKKPWVWAAMAKWTTVRDMMKWKAEMTSLDNVILSIEQETATPLG
jgi:hypothetical protein